MFFADSLAFFTPPAFPPVVDAKMKLDLAHLTSAPPWAQTMDEVLEFHRSFVSTLEEEPEMKIVKFHEDLITLQLFIENGIVLGLQSPPHDIEFQELFDEGIRIIGIAYEEENPFGGGFAAPETKLTTDGLSFLEECDYFDFILDLSHSGHQTARDVLDRAPDNLPIIASHGGCHSVYPHPRNLPDDVLRRIALKNGIVGIATLTFILDETRNDLEPFIRHVTRAVNVCGEDGVCIGGDGPYVTQTSEEMAKNHEMLAGKLDARGSFGARSPEHPLELNTPERMEVIAERLGEAFSFRVVDKLVWGNFTQFLNNHLPD